MKRFLVLVLAMTLPTSTMLASEPPEVRKCKMPDVGGVILAVDDVVLFDSLIPGATKDDFDAVMPPVEDILSIQVRCLKVRSSDADAEGEWRVRDAAIVVTRGGAQALAERHLSELVEAQRVHREQTGAFAQRLDALRFTESRASLEMILTTSDAGWAASVTYEDPGFECRVAVGADADGTVGQGQPVCTDLAVR
jgi:hypothetical protein